jgi:WD40 repeat protein
LRWAELRKGSDEFTTVGHTGVVSVWKLPQAIEPAAGQPWPEPGGSDAPKLTLANGIQVAVNQARIVGPLLGPRRGERRVDKAIFSLDGSRVAVEDELGAVCVWDTSTAKPLTGPLRHGDAVHYAAFNTDGARLLTASKDRTVRVWDAVRGEGLAPTLKAPGSIERICFLSNDEQALVTCAGGLVKTWDLTPSRESVGQLVALAQVLACGSIGNHQEQKLFDRAELRSAWENLQAIRDKEK